MFPSFDPTALQSLVDHLLSRDDLESLRDAAVVECLANLFRYSELTGIVVVPGPPVWLHAPAAKTSVSHGSDMWALPAAAVRALIDACAGGNPRSRFPLFAPEGPPSLPTLSRFGRRIRQASEAAGLGAPLTVLRIRRQVITAMSGSGMSLTKIAAHARYRSIESLSRYLREND